MQDMINRIEQIANELDEVSQTGKLEILVQAMEAAQAAKNARRAYVAGDMTTVQKCLWIAEDAREIAIRA